MKKRLIAITVFLAVAFIMGFVCSAGAAEEVAPTTIYVLFYNGVDETMDARQAKAQTQLSDWMGNDLVRVFARYAEAGYQAELIENREDFNPQPDSYLLTVEITEYHSGSKAARMFVGYGAGGVSLKIQYELSSDGADAILSKDDGVFSGREWVNAARKLNENMAKAVIEELGGE